MPTQGAAYIVGGWTNSATQILFEGTWVLNGERTYHALNVKFPIDGCIPGFSLLELPNEFGTPIWDQDNYEGYVTLTPSKCTICSGQGIGNCEHGLKNVTHCNHGKTSKHD